MSEQKPFYRLFLESVMAKRTQRNASYSLRAFARSLEMDVSVLSRIMAGKRALSVRKAKRVAEILEMSPEDSKLFLKSCAEEQEKAKLKQMLPESATEQATSIDEISAEEFQAVAELYHIAILELTFVDGFEPNPNWVAKALGIPRIEAKLALERLERLGFLERVDGTLVKTKKQLRTKDRHFTTQALMRYQEQILRGAIKSLKEDSFDRRNMTSMTMAVDPSKLATAKLMIQTFMNELCDYLETGSRRQVYQLGVTLYPIQREPSSGKRADDHGQFWGNGEAMIIEPPCANEGEATG